MVELGAQILDSIRALDSKVDRMQDDLARMNTDITLVRAQFLTESQIIKLFVDHQMQCPATKKSSSAIPRPVDANGVNWGTILKYTSILISVLGAGVAIGKLLV